MVLPVAALIATVIVGVYLLFFFESRKARLLKKIPGPPSLPILGNALDLNVSNEGKRTFK